MADTEPIYRQVGSWAWENKEWIWPKLKGIWKWFRPDPKEPNKPGILILGAGGVGKTTLARLLSGEFDLLFDAMHEYDESIGIERVTLKDSPNIEIVILPGQKHRRRATWAELHSEIAAGKYRGIILVSAFGYHSLSERSYKDHRLFKHRKDRFLNALLNQNRADEVEILRQLCPHLLANNRSFWLVTLVAKQDLWWPNRSDVEFHYQNGDYGSEIKRLTDIKGASLRHEFVFASLVIGNYVTKQEELLKPNSEGYDYRLQTPSLRWLFESVDALKNWENSR